MPLNPKIHSAENMLPHLPDGPLVGAEVGVLRGVNAMALLARRSRLLLYCVDNWQHGGLVNEAPTEIRREAMARLGGFDRVIWQEMDSRKAAGLHASSSLDFVHLDSCHDAHFLYEEIQAWLPAVKVSGGVLFGHDFGHEDYPGVEETVRAAFGDDFQVSGYTWRHVRMR